ncbi:SDR family NAD(P)-dependent oxidoreductase [Virgisporangium ochraceum]|uniref:Oxidoreductase n=1 Tax=Virgisporangium ochraceum TaxID=65505 RepID=A0A8J4EJL6_9ACTN|nr:SDR family NAD(P)-dependent oxidoreductase [Virgisporangium ochraceum]GIJ74442.1 oxidoreductase [Virgisporangium ochraceum]
MTPGVAVVTGASSGIGAATARRLATEGFTVVAAARRLDRLQALATETGATPVQCDVTSDTDVAALVDVVSGLGAPLTVLVNNAGGAFGADPVEDADLEQWRAMYEINVVGTVRVTRALLPLLEASGAGTIVMLGSTAGFVTYEGGGGYTAAKHAEKAVADTLRLELSGRPIRVIDVSPGMVRTDEFAMKRFGGDADKAAAVYEGVAEPLVAEDIADVVSFAVTRPHHVNIDRLVIRPLAQAAQHKVHRVK